MKSEGSVLRLAKARWSAGGAGVACLSFWAAFSGMECIPEPEPECRIEGQRHEAGQKNPANLCQVCAPDTSTSAWTNLAAGEACGEGLACSATGTCLGADGQACVTAADCAAGACVRYYIDRDGDGEGDHTTGGTLLCGATAPAGYAAKGGDCCDIDARAHSGLGEGYFSEPNACGSFDYDCDHLIEPNLRPYLCAGCTGGATCTNPHGGWCELHHDATYGDLCFSMMNCEYVMPRCGQSGPFVVSGGRCVFYPEIGSCAFSLQDAVVETRTMGCR